MLETILKSEYECTILTAPDYAILWAAERLPKEIAKAEVTKANRLRVQAGTPSVHVPYGHNAF